MVKIPCFTATEAIWNVSVCERRYYFYSFVFRVTSDFCSSLASVSFISERHISPPAAKRAWVRGGAEVISSVGEIESLQTNHRATAGWKQFTFRWRCGLSPIWVGRGAARFASLALSSARRCVWMKIEPLGIENAT